jgi:hypothetical protein
MPCVYMYVFERFMWHSSVEYWVCYSMFRSERTKVFPHVAWPGHGWSGTLQYGIRASVPTLSLMGQKGSVEANIHQKINFEVAKFQVTERPW